MKRHRMRLATVAGLVLSATAVFMPASARPFMLAPAEPPVQFPETGPGRIAAAYFTMINNPTDASVTAFESTYGSRSRQASADAAERIRRVGELRQRWGKLTPQKVLSSGDTSITIAASTADAQELEMEFQLSAAEAGKLEAIMISSGGPGVAAQPVSPAQIEEVIEAACKALEASYVFPPIAQKMAESVRSKLKSGEYASITDERELAKRLTADFRAVSNDKHLRVNLAPAQSAREGHVGMPGGDDARRDNYGFRKAELLPGNIGYLRFDMFFEGDEAYKVASGAMNFLANADAVIFDMRSNGGGSPEMIRFITSYLFDTRTHLNDMIDREGSVVEEYWTLDEVPPPGKRLAKDTPVFVLTSGRTFSGAEEFSYNLKNLKRATIIGETTGGGAHPVMGQRLNDRFVIGVPYMRANNPISKTNWEGTGVEPDIKTPAAEALDRALAEARKAIEQRAANAEVNK